MDANACEHAYVKADQLLSFDSLGHELLVFLGLLVVRGYLLQLGGLHEQLELVGGRGLLEEVSAGVLAEDGDWVVDLDGAVVENG